MKSPKWSLLLIYDTTRLVFLPFETLSICLKAFQLFQIHAKMKARFDGVLLLPSEALLICLGVLQSNSYLVGNLLWFDSRILSFYFYKKESLPLNLTRRFYLRNFLEQPSPLVLSNQTTSLPYRLSLYPLKPSDPFTPFRLWKRLTMDVLFYGS